MSIDRDTVKKVAGLARLRMSDEQLDKHTPEINNILKFIEQLAEVNTDNVEPLANVARIDLKRRPDEVTDGGYAQDVLKNAPEAVEGYFAVPKVVE